MTPTSIAAELEELRASIEDLKRKVNAPEPAELPKAEQLDVAEKSFQALLSTKGHLEDSGSRILAAIAFLTTAAVGIYRQALEIHSDACLEQWATLWFAAYMLCISLGALYLIGALWSHVWRKSDLNRSATQGHSLLDFKAAMPDATVTTYDGLLAAYKEERVNLIWEGSAVRRILLAGGAWVCDAFFFLLALTANLFTTNSINSGVPLMVILWLLCYTLLYGRTLREAERGTSPTPSPLTGEVRNPTLRRVGKQVLLPFCWERGKGWPNFWRVLLYGSSLAFFVLQLWGTVIQGFTSDWCPGWNRDRVAIYGSDSRRNEPLHSAAS
jgi:hypothetical protein